MNYKYYILSKGNNLVSGVISDGNGVIKYHDLTIIPVFNQFRGCDEDRLVKYYDSPIMEAPKDKLSEEFGNVEITKEYWTAWEHAAGRKRKAVAQSTES